MAVLARKISQYENSAGWVSVNLTHSCPFWPPPAPPQHPPSMICAWGPVTHASFKSSEGKYLDDPDGGVKTWEGGRHGGGLVRAELSSVRQGRCGESPLQQRWQPALDSCPLRRHPPPPPVSAGRQILCVKRQPWDGVELHLILSSGARPWFWSLVPRPLLYTSCLSPLYLPFLCRLDINISQKAAIIHLLGKFHDSRKLQNDLVSMKRMDKKYRFFKVLLCICDFIVLSGWKSVLGCLDKKNVLLQVKVELYSSKCSSLAQSIVWCNLTAS